MTWAHRLDVERRRAAEHRTRTDGAPGLAGVRAAASAANLEAHRADGHARRRRRR
jgi:hypothetical protein